MSEEYAIVTTACGGEDEAEKIASALLARKLAACIQAFPAVSRYIWKGETCKENEVLLFIKCRRDKYAEIERTILANRSYELPEILLVPIEGGYDKYLRWIDDTGSD